LPSSLSSLVITNLLLVAPNSKNYFIIVRRTICRRARRRQLHAVAVRRNYFLTVSKRRMTKMRKMKLGLLSGDAAMSVLFAFALLVAQAVSAARVTQQSAVERAVDSLIGVRTFHE